MLGTQTESLCTTFVSCCALGVTFLTRFASASLLSRPLVLLFPPPPFPPLLPLLACSSVIRDSHVRALFRCAPWAILSAASLPHVGSLPPSSLPPSPFSPLSACSGAFAASASALCLLLASRSFSPLTGLTLLYSLARNVCEHCRPGFAHTAIVDSEGCCGGGKNSFLTCARLLA